MTDRIPTTTPDLPDDPRDCCRAALKVMIRSDFEESLREAADAIEIAWACMAEDECAIPMEPLRNMLNRASEAMRVFRAELDRAHKLVRHGTNDHREFDRRSAEKVSAMRPDAA